MPVTLVLGGKNGDILETHWLVNLAKMVSFWFHERPCLKTIRLRAVEEDVRCLPQAHTYMCTGTYIQTLVWLHHIYTHNTTHNTHIHEVKNKINWLCSLGLMLADCSLKDTNFPTVNSWIRAMLPAFLSLPLFLVQGCLYTATEESQLNLSFPRRFTVTKTRV